MIPSYYRLNWGWAERVDDPEPTGEARIVTRHKGQDMGVNGCCIDFAGHDHVGRPFMVARFNDPTEVIGRFPLLNEVIANNSMTRL
jgi:hypothetical protein